MTIQDTDFNETEMFDVESEDRYSNMTREQLDAEIARLKTQLKSLRPSKPRTPRTKKEQKPVRHQRQVVCMYCGKPDKKTNMERISKYEYQHPMCLYREPKIVKVEFSI